MSYTFRSEFHSLQLRLYVVFVMRESSVESLEIPYCAFSCRCYLAWQRFAVASCHNYVECVVFFNCIRITNYFTSHLMFILSQVAVTIPSSASASPSASSLPSVATVNTASSAPLGENNFD